MRDAEDWLAEAVCGVLLSASMIVAAYLVYPF